MTIEEAIKIIMNYDELGCGYCHQGGDEIKEAFEMAVEALSKQIAKSPQKVEVQGYMRKHWNPKCCPVCRTQHYGKPKYCDECGQKLSLSDC